MFTYRYGGKTAPPQKLEYSKNKLVTRTVSGIETLDDAVKSEEAKAILEQFQVLDDYSLPDVNVVMLENKSLPENRIAVQRRARSALKGESNLRFAGRVLEDVETGEPVIYTENLFVKFRDDVKTSTCKKILKAFDLTLKKQQPEFAKNAFFVAADGQGAKVFRIANELLEYDEVEVAHPELIQRRVNRTPKISAVAKQWHLFATDANAHTNVDSAWNDHGVYGKAITIAVIDDGVDMTHQEFNIKGKIVAPRDMLTNQPTAQPHRPDETHGTNCAGVACAAGIKAPGVAPGAKLMPIRLPPGVGSMYEAAAFYWAAQNGADVISCSWGPPDGYGLVTPLPDSTRLAIDYAIIHGRGGKGCVIVWAAGNGNESVDDDGYASYEPVIAVAACTNESLRSSFSDFGRAIWCCFPGGETTPRSKAHGLFTTTLNNDYTNDFTGTSASCPGVAGIAALILSANPDLSYRDVRKILDHSAVKIDEENGQYMIGHSTHYGYGRPDASQAVELALSMKNAPPGSHDFIGEGAHLEAITFSIDTSHFSRAQVKQRLRKEKVLGSGWVFQNVEHSQEAIDALYTKKKRYPTVKEAWELTYRLRDQPEVTDAQPSFLLPVPGETDLPHAIKARGINFCPSDPETDDKFTWPLKIMKVPEAWEYTKKKGKGKPYGNGILIGHPDSGYRPHREFDADRLVLDNDWDFIDDDDETHEPSANGNHGLSTGSVIMSGNNTEPKPYVTGSAPKASLMPLRVAKQTIFPVPVLVFGGMRRLRRAINHAVDEGCRVISISLGGLPNREVAHAIERAVKEGVIVVAAAGNIVGWVTYPGSDPNVICVAASNIHKKHWRESCRGPQVDVTAPGELVWRAYVDENGNELVERSCGTSYSAALTAGVAALWLAHHDYAKLEADHGKQSIVTIFKDILTASCSDQHDLPPNDYGAGIVDAEETLKAKLPKKTTRTRRSVKAQPSTLDHIDALFPELPKREVHKTLSTLLNVKRSALKPTLEDVGDELLFQLATDYRFYADFRAVTNLASQKQMSRSKRAATTHHLQESLKHHQISDRLRGVLM